MRLLISTETFHVSDDVARSTFARRPSPGDPKGTKGAVAFDLVDRSKLVTRLSVSGKGTQESI
eukprot:scaffold21980_cov69-Cylindrotheca_fusiformis.AAC.1